MRHYDYNFFVITPLLEKAGLLALPAGISVFFPSENGLQDIMYRQDFGLKPWRAAFRRARKIIEKGRNLQKKERLLLLGYLDLFLGEYESAAETLKKARALWPDFFWSRFLYAAALWLRGDQLKTRDLLPEAFDAVNSALELKPGDPHCLMIRSLVRREMEDEEGRMRDIESLLKIDPGHVWARVEHVEILGETGRYKEGLREAAALIREFPDKSWAWAHRSRVHGFSGHYPEALDDLDRAIRLDPRSGAIRSWRAEVLRRLGRYREALAELKTASALDGGYAPIHIFTGRIHLQLGRVREALIHFNRALKEDSREVLAAAWRAECRWKLGRPKQAFEDFARIYPTEPRFTWNAKVQEKQAQESLFLYRKRASSSRRQEDFWTDLDAGVARYRHNSWAWTFRGRCLATASGNARKAVHDLNKAIRLDPQNAWAWAWRGETLRRSGRFTEAARSLKNALRLDKRNRWAWAWQGKLLHQMNRPKAALASYRRALQGERSYHLALIWAWRGEAFEAAGSELQAARSYLEAFALNGKLEEALQGLSRLRRRSGERGSKLLENIGSRR